MEQCSNPSVCKGRAFDLNIDLPLFFPMVETTMYSIYTALPKHS